MIALLQRVSSARVEVQGSEVGAIGLGLLVFLAVEREDERIHAERLVEKVCRYRMFSDHQGKMNLDVSQVGGSLLVVSQFTLAADTHTGLRPSFSPSADPLKAEALYRYFCDLCKTRGMPVAQGCFGAAMQVSLCNEGPVTFWLQVS